MVEIVEGTWGIPLRFKFSHPITGATGVVCSVLTPENVLVTWNAQVNVANRTAEYELEENDVAVSGNYKIQITVVFPDKSVPIPKTCQLTVIEKLKPKS